MINYRLKINFQDTKILASDMCFVSGDVNSNKLIFEFYDNGERVDISGYTLSVKSKRSDGVVVASAGKIEKNTGVFIPENSVYAVPGELYMEIALSDASGKYITTKIITAEVIKGLDDEPIESTDNLSVYVTLLNDVQHKIEMTNVALEEVRELKNRFDEKANVSDVYDRESIDALLEDKANTSDIYYRETINAMVGAKADINNVYYRETIDALLADIKPNQTTFLYKDVTYGNLYDSDTSTKGICVYCDTGEKESVNAYTSDYMSVEEGESYFIGRANGRNGQDMVSVKSWAFYDEDKNFMPQTAPSVAGGWNPIPEGVVYMRVSVLYGTGNTQTMVAKGTAAPTEYVSYTEGKKVEAGWNDEDLKKCIQEEQLKYDAENLKINGGRIVEHTLEPRQMTIAKVYDLNRVNPEEIEVGYSLNVNNGIVTAYQFSDVTGYIPVQENEKIYLNSNGSATIVFYDANKKFVQGVSLAEYKKNPMKGIVSPVTGFVRISFSTGANINVSDYFFHNNEYFAYGETLTIYEEETKEELNLSGITVEKWNLCDRNKIVLGAITNGAFTNLGAGNKVFYAIEDIPQTELTMIGDNSNDVSVVEYDSEWNYIQTVNVSITEPYIFRYTPSEKAVNILITAPFVVISNDARYAFVKHIVTQGYSSADLIKIQHYPKTMPDYFVKHLRKELLAESSNELLQAIHNSKGLKWNCLGDSLTTYSWNTGMYAIVSEKLGLIPTDYGIGSSTIADYKNDGTTQNPMCVRYADMSDDADIVTVMGCTNDSVSKIGTFEEMNDVTTLYGACHVLFKGLIEKYPNAKIGVILPPQNGQCNPTYVETQGGDPLMEKMSAKVAAVKEVAEFYGLPVCDLFHHGGISGYLDSSINNTIQGDYLHITTKGYQVLSKPLLAFMRNLIG